MPTLLACNAAAYNIVAAAYCKAAALLTQGILETPVVSFDVLCLYICWSG